MACDICGKKGCSLVQLYTQYQTDDIKDICGDCERDVNNHLWKIRSLNQGILERFLKRFMANKKEANQ